MLHPGERRCSPWVRPGVWVGVARGAGRQGRLYPRVGPGGCGFPSGRAAAGARPGSGVPLAGGMRAVGWPLAHTWLRFAVGRQVSHVPGVGLVLATMSVGTARYVLA